MNVPEKYLSTEEGLAFSEAIAALLGVEFDREGTRVEADHMHDLYFDAIIRTANLDPDLVRFRSAAYRNLNAYVPYSRATKGTVVFDELLDPWLMSATVLLTIMACKPLEPNEVRALTSAFIANLNVSANPFLHEQNRRRLQGFMCRHSDALPIAVPLRRAMVVFILCHEIGHIQAQHHRQNKGSDPVLEMEADARAVELYSTVCRAGLEAHPISVDPKLAGAPILMMEFFAFLEQHQSRALHLEPNAGTHPHPASRAAYLREALKPVLAEAYYVLDGFTEALGEIAAAASLEMSICRRSGSGHLASETADFMRETAQPFSNG